MSAPALAHPLAAPSAVHVERVRAATLAAMAKGEGPRVGVVRSRQRRGSLRYFIDFGSRKIQPRHLSTYQGVPFETEAQAGAFLVLIEHEVAKGRPLQDVVDEVGPRGGDGPQVEPLLREWVAVFRRRVAVGDLSGNSLREIDRWVDSEAHGYLRWWYGASLFSIDAASLEEWALWLAERGISKKTQRNVMAAMHSFCVWARKRRPSWDVPDFPWPKVGERVPEVVTLEVQAKILGAIPEPQRGAFLACAALGIRPNEARVARVCDWNGAGELHVHRGQKDRVVGGREGGTKKDRAKRLPVRGDLAAWLEANVPKERRLADPEGLLFRNPDAYNDRGQWSEAAMRRCWYKACGSVGVTISLYQGTKHTLGTALRDAGVDEGTVGQLFGHADSRSVRHYDRANVARLDAAISKLPQKNEE